MAGTKQLSNVSDEATEQTNTTGVRTSILDVQPEDGTRLIVHNAADGEAGLPIYFDPRDSNDDKLPLDTEFVVTFERNIDDDSSAVTDVQDNIQQWRARGVSEQQNEEYVDSVRVPLKGKRVIVSQTDTLSVEIESSAQIDWSNSALYFDKRFVEEVSGD